MNKIRKLCWMTFAALLATASMDTRAQTPEGKTRPRPRLGATAVPVVGGGTSGQISKWTGFNGPSSVLDDSNITEDKFGRIGIGTPAPMSLLTVAGMVETTLGGYKFPDGTVQTSAGISIVTHDASLTGLGSAASPLGIAPGGVNTIHLVNGSVTAAKIANGTVVRSFNGLSENLTLAAGANITITPAGNTLTIASPSSLTSVFHDLTLAGAGTSGMPLGVANGGIATTQLANNAVTVSKIAPGQVVTGLNGMTDEVTLAPGSNITITPSGSTLTITSTAEGSQGFIATGGPVGFLSNPGKVVVSKTVPAGSYVINFTVSLFNADTDNQRTTCTLSTGDSASIVLAPINEADAGSLTLQDAATFNGPTTITATCVGFKSTVERSIITAIKVGSIQ